MKKFMFLFLIVAFVAVMAGGAIAEETDCGPCPGSDPCDCTRDAELKVDIKIKGISCLFINQNNIPSVEAVVPCTDVICWGDPDDFGWKAWATCHRPRRQVVGWLYQNYPQYYDIHFKVDFGTLYGNGFVELPYGEGNAQPVTKPFSGVCMDDWEKGAVMVGAGMNAPCVRYHQATLKFRLIDLACKEDEVMDPLVF